MFAFEWTPSLKVMHIPLLVDSYNFTKSYGIARNQESITHNVSVLELPTPETLSYESDGKNMVIFPFGRYIVICEFTATEITKLHFFDYSDGIDKFQLPLLMQTKVEDTLIEQFLDIQYNLQMNFSDIDDIASLHLV